MRFHLIPVATCPVRRGVGDPSSSSRFLGGVRISGGGGRSSNCHRRCPFILMGRPGWSWLVVAGCPRTRQCLFFFSCTWRGQQRRTERGEGAAAGGRRRRTRRRRHRRLPRWRARPRLLHLFHWRPPWRILHSYYYVVTSDCRLLPVHGKNCRRGMRAETADCFGRGGVWRANWRGRVQSRAGGQWPST